ncbi:MAG: hypothetical protein WB239_04505 [Acidimicrobiia bacterium]
MSPRRLVIDATIVEVDDENITVGGRRAMNQADPDSVYVLMRQCLL